VCECFLPHPWLHTQCISFYQLRDEALNAFAGKYLYAWDSVCQVPQTMYQPAPGLARG
jgi:hypothetical protein